MEPHRFAYADRACHRSVTVDENRAVARDTYRLRIRCPEMAAAIVPGQFVMVRLPDGNDPLLGRPLALYDVAVDSTGRAGGLDIVYLAVGKVTRLLSKRPPGSDLEVWGPLGNGFAPAVADHLIMVAGGIGQTPFLALAREAVGLRRYGNPPRRVEPVKKVTLCYGARTREYLAGLDDFERAGVEIRVSTDDGSAGHGGLVTDLVPEAVGDAPEACRIVCCGPEPMMERTAALARALGVPCQVSLETPMACGIGICFSCVARVRDGAGGWDYRRTCVEGPVFDAEQIEF